MSHIIDCDADPFIPEGWEVVEHQKGGKLEFNPARIELYLCEKQKSEVINGNKLRKRLADKPVLNACVLDHLLAHQELIPDSWKGKMVFFWGTLYFVERICTDRIQFNVRGIFWNDILEKWCWGISNFGFPWNDHAPAAILK